MNFKTDINASLKANDLDLNVKIDNKSINLSTNVRENNTEFITTNVIDDIELCAKMSDIESSLNSTFGEDVILLSGGESNYNHLTNKPILNKKVIEGDRDLEYYGIKCYYTDKIGSDALGGIAQGEKFDNVSVIDILYKLLHKYQQPILSIGIAPTKTLYNCETETIESLKITANVTKRSLDIKWVKIYFNNQLLETFTENVSEGGVYSVDKTFATPIRGKSGQQYKAKIECFDGKKQISTEATITFVGISYVGVLSENEEISVDNIKKLNTNLKYTKYLDYIFNTDGDNLCHICYAYPKHLGGITSIKDSFNFENVQEYNKTELIIGNTEYLCYSLNNPVSVTDYKLTFS